MISPFSRTPRGFEARIWSAIGAFQLRLSAEPLVGLKRVPRAVSARRGRPFSRTPRGFEARVRMVSKRPRLTFSRTPRGFEAQSAEC